MQGNNAESPPPTNSAAKFSSISAIAEGSMPICALCGDLQLDENKAFRISFDFALAELDSSVSSGCRVCSLLRAGIECFESYIRPLDQVHRVFVYGRSVKSNDGLRLQLYYN